MRLTGNINQHRFFSLIIKHKRGISYEYTNIDKSEYAPLLEFLKSKNLNIQDDANVSEKKTDFDDDDDDLSESDEEDYVAEEEDEDDDNDDDDEYDDEDDDK